MERKRDDKYMKVNENDRIAQDYHLNNYTRETLFQKFSTRDTNANKQIERQVRFIYLIEVLQHSYERILIKNYILFNLLF